MMLPMLAKHHSCTDCDLHQFSKHPGLRTRAWDGGNTGKPKAVLILGKAPAAAEDRSDRVFEGICGTYTNRLYVEGVDLNQYADVYLQNAVRCRLPAPAMAVPDQCSTACLKWLEDDLFTLREHYAEVVILATGADAIKAVCGRSIPMSAFPQGQKVQIGNHTVRVFATYLAAILQPRKDPSKVWTVEAHLQFLVDYLIHGEMLMEIDDVTVDRVSRVPADVSGYVSVDVETYGCVETYPVQRFFHPAKMTAKDGVASEDIILTASIAWRQSGEIHHREYVLSEAVDRSDFEADLTAAVSAGATLLGQNFQFDLLCMRAWSPHLRVLLRDYQVRLSDLSVWNFLDCDQRPERSLKRISPLLRVTSYDDEEICLKSGDRYPTVDDARLLKYNAKDSIATLRCVEVLKQRIARKYGADTAKLKPETETWFSDLMWLALRMSEAGVRYDLTKLRAVQQSMQKQIAALEKYSKERHSHPLKGKGAGKAKQALADQCADDLNLRGDKRLRITSITKQIRADKENMKLFLEVTPLGHPIRKLLNTIRQYTKRQKTLSLVCSLLGEHQKKPTKAQLNNELVGEYAYPTWYIVPSEATSDFADDAGGTQQGRITSKGPALQTFPPVVEACETSRFDDGRLLSLDSAQIELRVPAMYSGEPTIIEAVLAGINLHADTAARMVGRPVSKSDKLEYAFGKMGNFAIQFRAGPGKLQSKARTDLGIEWPLEVVQKMLQDLLWNRKVLVQWQDQLIATAKTAGFLEVPVFGYTRTFAGTSESVDATYVPTICNFPVQTLAALLILSAQVAHDKVLITEGLSARLTRNTYDEGTYDCPSDELSRVQELGFQFYRSPPILNLLPDLHPVPLDCSANVR